MVCHTASYVSVPERDTIPTYQRKQLHSQRYHTTNTLLVTYQYSRACECVRAWCQSCTDQAAQDRERASKDSSTYMSSGGLLWWSQDNWVRSASSYSVLLAYVSPGDRQTRTWHITCANFLSKQVFNFLMIINLLLIEFTTHKSPHEPQKNPLMTHIILHTLATYIYIKSA